MLRFAVLLAVPVVLVAAHAAVDEQGRRWASCIASGLQPAGHHRRHSTHLARSRLARSLPAWARSGRYRVGRRRRAVMIPIVDCLRPLHPVGQVLVRAATMTQLRTDGPPGGIRDTSPKFTSQGSAAVAGAWSSCSIQYRPISRLSPRLPPSRYVTVCLTCYLMSCLAAYLTFISPCSTIHHIGSHHTVHYSRYRTVRTGTRTALPSKTQRNAQ